MAEVHVAVRRHRSNLIETTRLAKVAWMVFTAHVLIASSMLPRVRHDLRANRIHPVGRMMAVETKLGEDVLLLTHLVIDERVNTLFDTMASVTPADCMRRMEDAGLSFVTR